jgi:hypothetical protein
MRLRVERFLQTRLRSMLMPATLGLGLALGGCNSDALNTDDGGNQTVKKDASNTDTGSVSTKYMAQLPDSGTAVRYMAQQPDAGGAVAVYLAQVPPENT